MSDEDYEILPHEEIERLRHEVDKLKASPFLHGDHGENLMTAILRLNGNLEVLIRIFKDADEKLAQYYEETNPAKVLSDIKQQNETLAKGMLALADLVRKQSEPPVPQQTSPPNQPPSSFSAQEPFSQPEQWHSEAPMPRAPSRQTMGLPPTGPLLSPQAMPSFRPENIDDIPPPIPPKRGFFGRK